MASRRGTRRSEPTAARRRVLAAGAVFGALLVVPPFAVMAMTLGDGAPNRVGDPLANGGVRASEFDDRERRQVRELADRAVAVADDLGPAIGGLGEPRAPREAVEEWLRQARDARDYFAADLSGERETKVARGALTEGIGALVESAETYLLALEAPSAREALLMTRARRWRDVALQLLFVGSVQLDALGHALGTGHHHVTFQAR